MPREIFLRDKKIFQKPVREMYKIIVEKISAKKIPRTFYLKSLVEEDFKILLNYEIKIFWSVEDKIFKFLRKDWSGDGWEEKICKLEKIFEIEIVGLDFKKINLRK